MLRKFSLLFVTIFALQAVGIPWSWAETQKFKVVKEIQIRGTKNFKERAVRELIKTRPKDPYSETNLRDDIQTILLSGNYEDAIVETTDVPGGVRVLFKVKEKPITKRIDFAGNKKIGKTKLREEISLKIREGFDQTKLRNDTQKILGLYAEKGYPDAKVEPFTTFDENLNLVNVNFVVKEGNRILIQKVEFEGAQYFKQKKLRRLMKTKKRKVYDSEKLKKDLSEVELFYKNNGFARVSIGEPRIEYNPERTKITLILPLKEGARYTVGSFEFSGNTIYTPETLQKAVELKTAKLYNQEKHDETIRNLRELYLEKGYLHSLIEPEEITHEETGKIDFRFLIDEGNVIYIDRVFIEGLVKTKEKVIRREILLKPGDPFSSSKLRRSQEKIFNLGFIDDVKPDIQPAREPDKADLVMEIVEGKPGSLSAGAGYSSTDGLVGQLQLSHSNLFGLAQRMSLMWEFGARKQNYEINWTEPWFLNKPVSFGIDVYNTQRERLLGYTVTTQGGGVRVGPRFSDIYSLLFAYSFKRTRITNVPDSLKNEVKEGLETNSSLTTELSRDTRDFFFDPARGSRNSISFQLSGGPVLQGDTHLVKSILSSSWYWTLFRLGNYPFVFSINARGGAAREYSPSEDVPETDRFYVGGAESVRGYQSQGEIGPRGGGRVFTLLNAEYRIPLYVENKRRILQVVLFADLGGAWRSSRDVRFSLGDSSQLSENERFLKSSIGFGLRITTPVFPIRLDWGYGLNHRAGEEISQIHFTLGNLF
ncbi:MAG: outer membrane protein assembly factor BamA [Elusimicrobia bacterium]|nr:outer membrane protein assembly factor BamA [Elusimicrobiota bacterium]